MSPFQQIIKLSQILNTSPQTISRCNKELEEKGYLSIIKTSAKDSDTGLVRNEKIYHLDELSQAIVFTLQNHEDRLNNTDAKIKALEKQIEILLKANDTKNIKQIEDIEII